MSKNSKPQKPAKQMFTKRTQCDCVGQKHQLINNCLNCGKVVCAKQGEGPCFGCGNIVSKPDSNYTIVNDQALFPTLPKQQLNKISQERSQAILHRNKLVERDQSTTQGQNIFDQQLDYYQITQNQWVDEQVRQKAVDRILKRDRQVQQQQFIVRVKFDPITGQFLRQQVRDDKEQFKQEGRKYAQQKQAQQFKIKMQNAKKKAYDSRLVTNSKLNSLVQQLSLGKESKGLAYRKQELAKKAQVRKTNVGLLIEEQIDMSTNILPLQLLNQINNS